MALWHGQHFFTPIAWPPEWPASAIAARHADGEINAIALEKFGIRTIRGAGGKGSGGQAGGAGRACTRSGVMLRALKDGRSVSLTADVPKIGGVVGARHRGSWRSCSGRPIYPLAVVTRRRIQFSNWDRATISLPFGRGGIVIGEKVTVPSDADEAALEEARLAVGRSLNGAHRRAYELAGGAPWIDYGG